jgi:CheY-like chemotaxis protein
MAAVRTLPGEVAVPVPALILRGFVPASAPDAAGRPRRAHVLLVDGAAGMRAAMTFVLAAVGYRTTQAASAAEAVRLYAAERPDAVVVAVALPDAPAGQGIDLIRRIDPDAVCVASGTREQIPELLDAQILRGARGWILTPLVEQGQVLRRTIDGLTA